MNLLIQFNDPGFLIQYIYLRFDITYVDLLCTCNKCNTNTSQNNIFFGTV